MKVTYKSIDRSQKLHGISLPEVSYDNLQEALSIHGETSVLDGFTRALNAALRMKAIHNAPSIHRLLQNSYREDMDKERSQSSVRTQRWRESLLIFLNMIWPMLSKPFTTCWDH